MTAAATKIIAVTGGKGGTGKTTVAAALALSKKGSVLLIDSDVDCPNDHIVLGMKRELKEIVTQRIPKIVKNRCINCGKCARVCRYNAMLHVNRPIFYSERCNGCGACKIICKENALVWTKKVLGKIYTSREGNITLLSGELDCSEIISERVVSALFKNIDKRYDHIIIDTAAGTHCPVIEALRHSDEVLAVTEPTPMGAHDLEMILKLLMLIGKKGSIIINRCNIGDEGLITRLSEKYDTEIIHRIPYDKDIFTSKKFPEVDI